MNVFHPPSMLRGAHLQSILASSSLRRAMVFRQCQLFLAASHDEIADCGNGVRLLLQHTPPRKQHKRQVALLIHGWEGSAQSTYVLSPSRRLWDEGYRIVRLNLRDHGNSQHLNRDLFHSCRLDEVIGAVNWVQHRFPDERLVLGGFSLGGNFALRIAALAGSAQLLIDKVVAVCPVLDPAQTMEALDTGWPIYRWHFLNKWRRSLNRKKAVFPRTYDFGNLKRFRTLESMTDFFVCNYTEFSDLQTYLSGYTLTDGRLASIQVPVKMLLADDDPVIPISGLEKITGSSYLQIEHSAQGGHCGFLADYRLTSWLDEYLLGEFRSDKTASDSSQSR